MLSQKSKYHQSEDLLQVENELVEAAKSDINAFAPLYEKYYKQVFLYIFQRLEDKEMAFDITSQAFLKAMTSLRKFQFKGVPFSSWLYRIAHNEMIQVFRDKKAQRVVNVKDVQMYELMDEAGGESYEEFLTLILKLIQAMPDEDVLLIEMRFFEKRSFKEISEILNITETNAKVKMHRLMERIKKEVKEKIQ